ncbi:MAG: HipA domain-containing protein [Thiothrix sp.]|uniref:HipA domain-containing protein n=1 Tax=Thiothrix sp. TaxID=1032 RepID=UPI002619833C|nr:HipA domain-containing protein [Thiothrix sp.]MDD5392639.1 HipA domain-containing protein [Thiothrix sp.]
MYQITEITERHQLEQLGSKPKFWFYDEAAGVQQLCKVGRAGTGENWAEKVAYELARLIGLPSAGYDLATWQKQQAVVSPSFVPENWLLAHGNEILTKFVESYDEKQAFQLRQYRLNTVMALLYQWQQKEVVQLPLGYKPTSDEGVYDVAGMFVAYLMFDCLIGNQDRHDQNWGIILDYTEPSGGIFLAPSFDHASSLACRLTIEEKKERLKTKDVGYSVEGFARKARTPFFSNDGTQRLRNLECFESAAMMSKKPAQIKQWVERLGAIEPAQIEHILGQVPAEFGMDAVTSEFTLKYLEANRKFILGLEL